MDKGTLSEDCLVVDSGTQMEDETILKVGSDALVLAQVTIIQTNKIRAVWADSSIDVKEGIERNASSEGNKETPKGTEDTLSQVSIGKTETASLPKDQAWYPYPSLVTVWHLVMEAARDMEKPFVLLVIEVITLLQVRVYENWVLFRVGGNRKEEDIPPTFVLCSPTPITMLCMQVHFR